MTPKIQAIHLARRAIVYVRQSTTAQVRENKESTARQYALVERARELGWSGDAIITIDEDLGQSGATTEGRPGFRRLCETLAHGDAGAVFALEVSRLARCSQDWQRLIALCAVAQVVVGDEHTIYDPRCGDDKLLLDFKGTMSEAELRWLSLRLRGAQNAKARRGALHFNAPTGYIWTGEGFEMDPDLAVRRAIRTIFERFEVEPTVGALLRWAHRRGFQVPTRRSFADGTMELDWNPICRSRLGEILKNPIYAGAYAYGRRSEKKALIQGQIRTVRNTMEPEEWVALIREAHEGYISWESYLANLDKLRANAARRPSSGAPREGLALLTGMLLCGRCGRPMTIGYLGQGGKRWMYVCRGDQDRGAKACWTVSGMAIDAAVEQLFLRMVIPAELDLTLAVEHEVEAQSASLHEQWKLRLEQAEYEARRAERRYMAVDPDNRTVARTLEAQWEAALLDREEIHRRFDSAKRERRVELSAGDRARIRELARDLPSVWRARTTTPADRKAMLRIVIEAVSIRPVEVPARQTHIQVQWRSGAVDELTIPRPGRGDHRRTPPEADAKARELVARGLMDEEIAVELNRLGLLTGARRPWNPRAVKGVRMRLGLKREHRQPTARKRPLPDQRSDGRYSVPGAARLFGVADSTIVRWIKRRLIKADREDFGQYQRVWWLTIDERCADRLRRAHAQWQKRRSTPPSKDTGDAL